MLAGSQRHQIDGKNRMRIPAKFKQYFKGDLIMSLGVNKAIYLYTADEYGKLISTLSGKEKFSREFQQAFSVYSGFVFEVEEDNQGRILVPEELRLQTGMKKDIVSVGMIDHVEIWAEEERNKLYSSMSFDQSMDKLKELTENE